MNLKYCQGNNSVRSADLHSVNKLCILLAEKRVTFICTKKTPEIADKAANPLHSYVAEEAA